MENGSTRELIFEWAPQVDWKGYQFSFQTVADYATYHNAKINSDGKLE